MWLLNFHHKILTPTAQGCKIMMIKTECKISHCKRPIDFLLFRDALLFYFHLLLIIGGSPLFNMESLPHFMHGRQNCLIWSAFILCLWFTPLSKCKFVSMTSPLCSLSIDLYLHRINVTDTAEQKFVPVTHVKIISLS